MPAGLSSTLLGLVAIALTAGWVTRSSIFDARSITVTGNRHVGRAEILRLAGVGSGTNLVWFSPGAVEDRLERGPWILEAAVSRALPGALTISVKERTAIAVVLAETGSFLVAADRTILAIAEPGVSLPEIETPAALRVGGFLPVPSPALQVLGAMPASLRMEVDRVAVDRDGLLVVTLERGIRAIYGDASHAVAKGLAVQELLRYAAGLGITPARLDVRAPERPALVPSSGAAAAA